MLDGLLEFLFILGGLVIVGYLLLRFLVALWRWLR